MRTVQGRCHFSAYGNISISVWVGQGDVAAFEALIEVTKGMVARYPRGYASVHFVLPGLPGPTTDALPLLGKALAARPEVACTAIILEGDGFWASGLRSMLNNSHRQAGSSLKMRIGTTVDALVGWFTEEHGKGTGRALEPSQLRDVLLTARQSGELAARG